MDIKKIEELLGSDTKKLLEHQCKTISKDKLSLPSKNFIDNVFMQSDRNPQVLRNLQNLYSTGRLSNTGYLSILPVDQGIETFSRCFFCS